MAQQITNVIEVVKPEAGKALAYLMSAGARVDLTQVDLSNATISMEGSNMRLTFADDSEIILLDFATAALETPTPVLLTGDAELPAQALLASLNQLNTTEVEPAAGPEAGTANNTTSGFAQPFSAPSNFGESTTEIADVINPYLLNPTFGSLLEELLPQVDQRIDAGNAAPLAVNDTFSLDEDSSSTFSVLANDTDADGDTLTITTFTQPANGTLVLNADGTFTYTPNEDYNGVDTFEYTITDGNGTTSTATVDLNVTPIADFPYAVGEIVSTDEDTPLVINVLANDYDSDSPTQSNAGLSVSRIIEAPKHGSIVINADGTLTYTPDANYSGDDTFRYEVINEEGNVDTALATVVVNPINDAPHAADDSIITEEDTPVTLDLLANDSDVDRGDTITIVNGSITTPANGTLVVNADGTVTYTPNLNFTGIDTFEYTITDGSGATSTATATVIVGEVNDDPTAVDDTITTNEDTPVVIDALANDFDVDFTSDGDVPVIDSFQQPANGTVVLNADGTFTYTPNEDYNGVDTFQYTVTDGYGGFDTATVTVNVAPVADFPYAVSEVVNTDEDTPIVIDVLANDYDSDSPTQSNAGLSVSRIIDAPQHGSVVINADGTVTYTPNANYNGEDTFRYEVINEEGNADSALATVVVNPVNDVPVAVDDHVTTREDNPVTINLLANDSDVEGTPRLVLGSITQPANGTVVLNTDGTVTYTPNHDYNGTDSFEYTITDAQGATSTATATVHIAAVPDYPYAVSDLVSTDEDTPLVINVLANDYDSDSPTQSNAGLSVSRIIETPQHGSVEINADGTITYTPDANYNGSDMFRYEVINEEGNVDTALATIIVNPVNDAPHAVDDTFTLTTEEQTVADAFNVVLTIDRSGSMGRGVDGTNKTRLDFMKEGLLNLVSDYQDLGMPVNFSIVQFNQNAFRLDFNTNDFAAVRSAIHALTPDGQTDYENAEQATLDALQGLDINSDNQTDVYFVSDGYPTIGSFGNGTLLSFANQNGVDLNAFGFGSLPARTDALSNFDNTNGATLLTDPTDLPDALNVTFEEFGMLEFTTAQLLANDSDVDSSFNYVNGSLHITNGGGTLQDLGNGRFSYIPSDAELQNQPNVTLQYTIADAQGATSTADVTINIVDGTLSAPTATVITPLSFAEGDLFTSNSILFDTVNKAQVKEVDGTVSKITTHEDLPTMAEVFGMSEKSGLLNKVSEYAQTQRPEAQTNVEQSIDVAAVHNVPTDTSGAGHLVIMGGDGLDLGQHDNILGLV